MSTPEPQPVTLHNTVGETVPTVTDDQGFARAVAPNGRLVVAAGQIIASAWGNTTYDQSMMTFANVADRTNQWPVPTEGALSFLVDSATPWIYRQGAWRALPLGFMNSATGPAAQTDYTSTIGVIATTSFSIAAGRAYRVSAYCYGTVVTATSTVVYRIRTSSPGVPAADTFLTVRMPGAVNDIVAAAGVALMQPISTGTGGTAQLLANTGPTGAVRVAANGGMIMVEDIGG